MPLFAPHIVTPDSALGGKVIEKSLRFNGDDTYLNRTPTSTSNRRTWTWSAWIKKTKNDAVQDLFSAYNGSSYNIIRIGSSNELYFQSNTGNIKKTSAKLRDTTSWYHIVVAIDTTSGTAADRVIIYINGSRQSLAIDNSVSQNTDYAFNITSQPHTIGVYANGSSYNFDGYMAEINFVDGYQYDPSYFGYTESQTGMWRPKKYEGTHGTNGFRLDFRDSSSVAALGHDRSGNGNNYSSNNFSVTAGINNDSVEDTPSNNFCTLNAIQGYSYNTTFANGNLFATIPAANTYGRAFGNIPIKSGKWYYEVYYNQAGGNGDYLYVGLQTPDGQTFRRAVRGSDGEQFPNTGTTEVRFTTGDYINVAVDLDAGKWYIGRNGTYWYSGNPVAGTGFVHSDLISANATTPIDGLIPLFYNATSGASQQFSVNFGQQAFSYTPPTGYRTINSRNLATPVASEIIKPQRHFETLLWDGNSTQDRNITGLEFKPDFVWIKSRSHATYGGGLSYHHLIWDVLRGVGSNTIGASSRKELTVNQSYEEGRGANYTDYYGHVSSFNEDGFQLDFVSGQPPFYVNQTSRTYVAWCWKAGGAGVSNSDGSIASTVSANTEAGFSIVTYTGSGSNATIGHGLDEAPQVLFVKTRTSADHWAIYHHSVGNTKILYLNLSNSPATSSNYWNDTTPTSTVFSIGSDNKTGKSGDNYVAYCWHEVPGYSKFGSYTGNGSADGPFIHLGFRPAWFLQKKTSGTGNWYLFDSKRSGFNVDNDMLVPNETDAEYDGDTYPRLDFLSNGIKWRDAGSSVHNASDATYVYMAFAERPSGTIFGVDANAR